MKCQKKYLNRIGEMTILVIKTDDLLLIKA